MERIVRFTNQDMNRVVGRVLREDDSEKGSNVSTIKGRGYEINIKQRRGDNIFEIESTMDGLSEVIEKLQMFEKNMRKYRK
jgi:DNA-binding winged helix-turn-helix (wHTH) protein